MRRALCNTSPSMPHTTVRLPSGTKSRQSTLTEIKSVDILSLRDDPGPFRSYTIIIFNIQSLTNLTFWGGADMPVEQVSAMLPHLTLPALRHLTLRIDGIDSTSLGDFLLRNTALETLAFRPWGEAEPKHTRWISPPIAHPGLTQISASGADNINGLMKCLHRSPLLGNFDYTLSETENLIALNPTFRLLSHRSRDADLALSIYGVEGSDEPFADEEAANIARALHCIPSVEIRCWSARLALKTLPWLVLFPGLRHVTFCLYIRGWAPRRNSDDPELQAELAMLIHEATATLSQVQEIDGEVR
ncbi:hypothetical protein DFH09DRAFT_1185444 [Mycena vulgaris]|nr:hypothetical protein DFH09DRAFT_1185444 [Mycena vulgaris]